MPRERAESQLLEMVDVLRHEPFYAVGTWVDERMGVYVGWTVAKHSFADGMPLRNESGDVVLVFSGEDVRGPGIQRDLEGRHRLAAEGPEYLVHLSEEDPSF